MSNADLQVLSLCDSGVSDADAEEIAAEILQSELLTSVDLRLNNLGCVPDCDRLPCCVPP